MVRGLLSFLKNNQDHLATKVNLSDTTLVIDANNLLWFLFAKSCANGNRHDVYGGDLVRYAEVIRRFFKSLNRCNIKPVLVLDGSVIGKAALKDVVTTKENQVKKKCFEAFERVKAFRESSYDQGDFILPQIVRDVFRNVAKEMGVQRIQAPYEADGHIARLANEMDCYVLTNDSDFIIFNLKRGFLMLDCFEYERTMLEDDGPMAIKCLQFDQTKLMSSLPGLQREVMPLVSILLGNDFVERDFFDGLVKKICGKYYQGKLSARTYAHRQIANLLNWLQGQSLQQSIDQILKHYLEDNRARLENLIGIFLRNFRIGLVGDFDSELKQIYPSHQLDQNVIESKRTPALFIRKQMEEECLSRVTLDMIFSNPCYNWPTPDDLTLPSSAYVKRRPYSLALTLSRRDSSQAQTKFDFYDREDGEYKQIPIKQMTHLENFGPLDQVNCYSMITMEADRKKDMLMACFHFTDKEMELLRDTISRVLSGPFVDEAAICLILVKYIGVETKMAPNADFVSALMLTLIYYAALSKNLDENSTGDDSYNELLLKLAEMAEFSNGVDHEDKNQAVYSRIMHYISQLQWAYEVYCMINSLLDHVFHPALTGSFFNSLLVFRLTRRFKLQKSQFDEMCADLPGLDEIISDIRAQVLCTAS